MRRSVLLIPVLLIAAAGPALAGSAPRITASPSVVRFGETLTIRGSGWPVIEFCGRRVRISLRTSQNAFRIGTARTRRNGRFTFRWIPRRARVGAGRWRVVARVRCQSGQDGSPVVTRASDRIRIVSAGGA